MRILRTKQALMVISWIVVIIIGLSDAESGLNKEENDKTKENVQCRW